MDIFIIILIFCCCCLSILGGGAYYSFSNKDSSIPKISQPLTTTQSSQPLTTTQSSQPLTTTQSDKLYEFNEHKFTTAGKTGRFGPTLEEVKKAYSNVSWAQNIEFLNVKDGIQEWKVPETGKYIIRAVGSSNADLDHKDLHEPEAVDMTGTFRLNKGDIIKILVGQKGVKGKTIKYKDDSNIICYGGGGGSFVVLDDILIIAGGGSFLPALKETTSNKFLDKSQGINYLRRKNLYVDLPIGRSHDYFTTYFGGGIDGRGGEKTIHNPRPDGEKYSGGGGGYFTSGANVNIKTKTPIPEGGKSFIEGGFGGKGDDGADGGFGGGGGGLTHEFDRYYGSEYCRYGGGGGYSGGFPDNSGGSINNGYNQDNKMTKIEGDGFVIITKVNTSPTEFLKKKLKKIEEDNIQKAEDYKKEILDREQGEINAKKLIEQKKIWEIQNAKLMADSQAFFNAAQARYGNGMPF
jgi:hypothetical protein